MKSASISKAMDDLKRIAITMVASSLLSLCVARTACGQVGWAVGNNGTILSTTDGTQKNPWRAQAAGLTTANLRGVASGDQGKTAWVVGDSVLEGQKPGAILYFTGKTDKKGDQEWQLKLSNTLSNLNGVYFLDATHGWAVGNSGAIVVYDAKTDTWNPAKKVPNGTPDLYAVFFLKVGAKYLGWAVGDVRTDPNPKAEKPFITTVLYTDDGGKTWMNMPGEPRFAKQGYTARGIAFVKDPGLPLYYGWLVGDDKLGIWVTEYPRTNWIGPGQAKNSKLQTLEPLARGSTLRTVQAFAQNDVWAFGDGASDVMHWSTITDKKTRKPVTQWRALSGANGVNVIGAAILAPAQIWGVYNNIDINTKKEVGRITYSGSDARKDNNWGIQKTVKELLKAIAIYPIPKGGQQSVRLDEQSSPAAGGAGVNYVGLVGTGFPEGDIKSANVVVELAAECHGTPSAATSAVSIVSGSGDSELLSFLLPGELDPGQYFISISDSEEGDANFESSNCSEVTIVQ